MSLFLSFIIPVYNLQDWILACFDSILKVHLGEEQFEIIVWNDGSKDKSEEIVKSYAEQYPQIRLESHENHGVSYSRNRALEMARGEYVWFVDGDDEIDAEAVPVLLKKMQDNNLDMLQIGYKDISLKGDIKESWLHLTESNVMSGRDLFLTKNMSMAPWSFIYRRAFLMDNNLRFPEDFRTCEDVQFNQKALFFANRAMTTSVFGYFYRQRISSATQGQAHRVMTDHVRRLPLAVEYFLPYKDLEFLTNVVFRNAREILVWLRDANPSEEDNILIKKTMREALSSFRPTHLPVRIYLYVLCYIPRELCAIQQILNRIKRLTFHC